MAVWLVAEDRVQVVRADKVVSFAVASAKPTGIDSADPVARMNSWNPIQVLASTGAARNAESPYWTTLITCDGDGKISVKLLAELTTAIEEAEQRLARSPGSGRALFIHGPLPRVSDDPSKNQVWHISEELPVKGWPTSGTYFKDPLP
jgi:hypothetical protein